MYQAQKFIYSSQKEYHPPLRFFKNVKDQRSTTSKFSGQKEERKEGRRISNSFSLNIGQYQGTTKR